MHIFVADEHPGNVTLPCAVLTGSKPPCYGSRHVVPVRRSVAGAEQEDAVSASQPAHYNR